MIQIDFIRENKDMIIEELNKKHFRNAKKYVEIILETDAKRMSIQKELDESILRINMKSNEIEVYLSNGEIEAAEDIKNKSNILGKKIKELIKELKDVEEKLNDKLVKLPNIPHTDVPDIH